MTGAIITLNRPEIFNRVGAAMVAQIMAAFDQADADDHVRGTLPIPRDQRPNSDAMIVIVPEMLEDHAMSMDGAGESLNRRRW